MKDLEGKTILITGATSGMGKYIAEALAYRGANILLHGRSSEKLNELISSLNSKTGNTNLRPYIADLSSLKQVELMAKQIIRSETDLDALINNAGVGTGAPNSVRQLSRDGFELRFAVNYLAPFLLTRELLPLLKSSHPSRVINVASAGQRAIDFSNVMLDREYSGARAYTQSKLAMIMMTFDFAPEFVKEGITVNALHPATYMDTYMVRESLVEPISTVSSGGEPTISLATDPKFSAVTGRYFDHLNERRADTQAYDPNARKKLRTITDDLIGRAIS